MATVIITAGRASYFDGRKRHVYEAGERAEVPDKVATRWAATNCARLISPLQPEPQPEAIPEATSLDEMTVAELKAECAKRGIECPKRAKKSELLALLASDTGTTEGAPEAENAPTFEVLEPEDVG